MFKMILINIFYYHSESVSFISKLKSIRLIKVLQYCSNSVFQTVWGKWLLNRRQFNLQTFPASYLIKSPYII